MIDVKETGHAVPKDVLDTIYELKDRSADRMCYDDWCNTCGGRRRRCTKVEKIAHYVGHGIPDSG